MTIFWTISISFEQFVSRVVVVSSLIFQFKAYIMLYNISGFTELEYGLTELPKIYFYAYPMIKS